MRRVLPYVAFGAILAATIPVGFVASRQAALLTSAQAVQPVVLDHPGLRDAERKVSELGASLQRAEAQLHQAQSTQVTDQSRKAALAAAVTSMERKVSELNRELTTATQRRDTLHAQLKATADALLDRTNALVDVSSQAAAWHDHAVDATWAGIVANAKVDLCDKGTRRRHARCREAVDELFDADLQAFAQACIRHGQATPALVAIGEAGLPDHAVPVPSDRRFSQQGLAVQLCDPTLPEADEVLASR